MVAVERNSASLVKGCCLIMYRMKYILRKGLDIYLQHRGFTNFMAKS
jgi:hypothetical protein